MVRAFLILVSLGNYGSKRDGWVIVGFRVCEGGNSARQIGLGDLMFQMPEVRDQAVE